jgi:LPXTG-site transpeptidase (sortase) family protein
MNPGRGHPALPALGAIATAILVGLVLAVAACGGGGGGDKKASGQPTADFHAGLANSTEIPTPEATIDLTRPTVVPQTNPNLTKLSGNDRIIISKFGIDAPLNLKTVGSDGQMPDPDTADDVVLYDFSAWPGLGGGPGTGGNAVLAGHVDSGRKACKNGTVKPPCQAVFWDVNKLKTGDEIEIKVNGQSFKYSVKANQAVSATTGPWEQIVSSTAEETITLITCGGTFSNGEYNNRQVVTAVRLKA